MTDLIKKAVELADGWEWQKHSQFFGKAERIFAPHIAFKVPLNDLGKAALAAQLVRQVDAIDDPRVCLSTSALYAYCTSPKRSGASEGNDRTLNTIRAIVGSGVLE